MIKQGDVRPKKCASWLIGLENKIAVPSLPSVELFELLSPALIQPRTFTWTHQRPVLQGQRSGHKISIKSTSDLLDRTFLSGFTWLLSTRFIKRSGIHKAKNRSLALCSSLPVFFFSSKNSNTSACHGSRYTAKAPGLYERASPMVYGSRSTAITLLFIVVTLLSEHFTAHLLTLLPPWST